MNYQDVNRESTIGLNSGRARMSFDEDGYKKKERNCCVKFCCCCCLSRKGALLCAVFTILLLGGIGAAIFFLFPRIPGFTFKNISYQDGTSVDSASVGDKLKRESNGMILVPLKLNVDIKSENYIDIVVSNITINGKINGSQVGQGSLPSAVSIKANSITPFSLPFTLQYNTKDQSTENLSLADLLKKSCNSNPSKRKKLTIDYNAKLYIDLIKWTGYIPEISNKFDFDCPWDVNVLFDQSDVLNLLSKLFSK